MKIKTTECLMITMFTKAIIDQDQNNIYKSNDLKDSIHFILYDAIPDINGGVACLQTVLF